MEAAQILTPATLLPFLPNVAPVLPVFVWGPPGIGKSALVRGFATDLDAFDGRALADGLDLHCTSGCRGLLPGDPVEEIRAIQQRPIPWDLRLGQWLDAFLPILVITDGACDMLDLHRDHAYLMPEGARLAFRTDAPRFAFERDE
jgi:hypothetical protein